MPCHSVLPEIGSSHLPRPKNIDFFLFETKRNIGFALVITHNGHTLEINITII